jgi:hypothetical protein
MHHAQLADHRDLVITHLSTEFAADRLDVDELERRLALAQAADSVTALDALVTDIVPASTALVPQQHVRVRFGSVERAGRWSVPAQLSARVVCGHLELDLRDATLAADTTIEVHVTMGAVEVLVPPGVMVDVDVNPTFGGIEDRSHPEAPTKRVRIVGRVTFGSVEVETRLCGESRREARWRRPHEHRMRRGLLRHG